MHGLEKLKRCLFMRKTQMPKFWVACLALFCTTIMSSAQTTRVITGTIVSAADGRAVEAATIQALPGNRRFISDVDGKFSFTVGDAKTVRITCVGFTPFEQALGDAKILSIKLEATSITMEDVVVVGYTTQKKVNLTGSVQTVRFADAVNQPVTNSAQLLYGKVTGVQLTQGSGLPGSDASSILIRGQGTFGNSTPLVVIDNIQYTGLTEFNNLAPTDIETISVLKDASAAAIYGARGANGVILVTTKRGKSGKPTVDYNNYFGFQQVTVVPEYLNGLDYALLFNEKLRNTTPNNPVERYRPSDIEAIRNGTAPDRFANTNWADEILRNAPIQQHYLAFSGGSENTSYRVSAGFLTQDAVVKGKFKNDRYTLGVNLNTKATKWLAFDFNSNTFWARFSGPSGGPGAITGETGIINQFQRSQPTVPAFYPNGNFGFADGAYLYPNQSSLRINNPLWRGQFGNYENDNINTSNRFAATVTFLKNFSFEVSGAANINTNNTSNFSPTRVDLDWENRVIIQDLLNTLNNNYSIFYRLQNENILKYQKQLGKHKINALAGYSAIYDRSDGFSGSLQGFPSNALEEFDAGGVVNPAVNGSANEATLQSYFGRVNYSFDDKYLFEANVRRDGSSRFGSNFRSGTFPSFSAGWNVDREKFMQNLKFISSLKLRGSWGLSGNDRIGNYLYNQNVSSNNIDYTVGNDLVVGGVALTILANPNVKWEETAQYDIGVDLGLFRNKILINADYFRRNTTDILYSNFPLPSTIGVTALAARNAAAMLNEGVELNVAYQTRIGDLKMTLSGNVTWMADNEVTNLGLSARETISGNTIIRIGQPLNAFYGFRKIGIFQNAAEVAAAPRQFGSTITAPGDIRYADVSGPAGKPDGIVDANDRVVIGNPYPRWIYGFNASFDFKGFDLNAVFQGVGKLDRILNSNGQLPLEGDRNNALSYWINRWTPTNPSTTLPRLGGINNAQISTFYVEDVSYLRLRNIELGYALPASIGKKIGIQKLRVFVSGQNILTFTKQKNFDPERSAGGATDQLVPIYKVFTTGINLKF
ncbi:MAG: TonB-dependent receptor [Bacteroidetes bacterium]|nr:MAG: TonB-dependent receptor [Bacteroidota bacterium]